MSATSARFCGFGPGCRRYPPQRLRRDDRADLGAGRNRVEGRDDPGGGAVEPRRAVDDQQQGRGRRRSARRHVLQDQLAVANLRRAIAGDRVAIDRDRLARAGKIAVTDAAGDAERAAVDAAHRQACHGCRQRLLAFDPHAMADVGPDREVAIDQRRERQARLRRLDDVQRRADAELELDGAVRGHRERLGQHAIGAFAGDQQRIAPLLHRDPLIGGANVAAPAIGGLALLAVDPQCGARHHAARRQRQLQTRLARDRLGIAEFDRPFEIGDGVVAADRAVDARGGELQSLHSSADLCAAVVVVELDVGENGPSAFVERRRLAVERYAVHAIVDFARFGRFAAAAAAGTHCHR